MKNPKKYHLVIRLKKMREYGTRIDIYSDDIDEIQRKIKTAKEAYKDNYVGYELYKLSVIEEG